MKKALPIGIFDSGVGGTSIWKEIVARLPHESTIYLADSKNAPYGTKSEADILQLSIKNTEKLLELGVKLIVVACNTATTNAIDYLRSHYEVPFIGIEPAIKPAALHSQTKKIGILATQGTLNSRLFAETSEKYAGDHEVIEVIGKGLVPLIEQGRINHPKTKALLRSYIHPMIDAGIDHIVLGCSHYPYLIPLLRTILPDHIQILDSGLAAARQTEKVLETHRILALAQTLPQHNFYSNDQIVVLKALLSTSMDKATFEVIDF